jgi:hypothetical protein
LNKIGRKGQSAAKPTHATEAATLGQAGIRALEGQGRAEPDSAVQPA